METLLIIFIAVTAVAVVIQMCVLLALFLAMRKSRARMEALAEELRSRAIPILDTAQSMITTYRPRIDAAVDNVTEASNVVKQQVAAMQAPINEAMERARLHAARVDGMVGRTLDCVENARSKVERSFDGPVRQATGVLQGVTVGLATLFGRGAYVRAKRPVAPPKDEMFI